MNIAVCVKQVPAGQKTLMDPEKGVLIRIAADSVMNPYDPYAIEAALQIAEAAGGRVTAVSMGPASAEKVLREAMAMGVDAGVLLCDSAFAGADVYATAFTLAAGLRQMGGFDLVLCGQQTTDGDTAQVPFALAAMLGWPAMGWVKHIESAGPGGFAVLQEVTGGTLRVTGTGPAVLAISREAAQPRLPTLAKRLKAQKATLTTLTLADLPEQDRNRYGLKGSPTRVKKIFAPESSFKAPLLREAPAAAAALLAEELARAGKGAG